MKLTEILLKEMEREARTTRKMLKLVPDDKLDWQPHEKSMSLKSLATHLSELPGWVKLALTTSVLDFATSNYKPTPIENNGDLLNCFEKNYRESYEQLAEAKDEDLLPGWIMRMGDKILSEESVGETIRHAFSQTIHHRAQLGVYLRLLNISIPGSYGPSADDPGVFA